MLAISGRKERYRNVWQKENKTKEYVFVERKTIQFTGKKCNDPDFFVSLYLFIIILFYFIFDFINYVVT